MAYNTQVDSKVYNTYKYYSNNPLGTFYNESSYL